MMVDPQLLISNTHERTEHANIPHLSFSLHLKNELFLTTYCRENDRFSMLLRINFILLNAVTWGTPKTSGHDQGKATYPMCIICRLLQKATSCIQYFCLFKSN